MDIQRNMHRALVWRVWRNVGGRDGLGRVVDGVALLEEPVCEVVAAQGS